MFSIDCPIWVDFVDNTTMNCVTISRAFRLNARKIDGVYVSATDPTKMVIMVGLDNVGVSADNVKAVTDQIDAAFHSHFLMKKAEQKAECALVHAAVYRSQNVAKKPELAKKAKRKKTALTKSARVTG